MATFVSYPISGSAEYELNSRVPIIQMVNGDFDSTVYNLSFKVPIMLSSSATLSNYWFKVVLFTHPFNKTNWTEEELTSNGFDCWYYRRTGSSSSRLTAINYKDVITNSSTGGSGTILYDSKWIYSDTLYEKASDAVENPLEISLNLRDGGDGGSYTSGIPASSFLSGLCVAFISTTDTDPNNSAPTNNEGYSYFEMPIGEGIYNLSGLTSSDYYTVTYISVDTSNTWSNIPPAQTAPVGTSITLSNTIPTDDIEAVESLSTLLNYNGSTQEMGTYTTQRYERYRFSKWQDEVNGISYSPGQIYSGPNDLTLTLYRYNTPDNVYGGFYLPEPTINKTGHTFKHWNTSSTGTGQSYNAGDYYAPTESGSLFAIWEPITYTVSYNVNGGLGAPANQIKYYGEPLTLSGTKPSKENTSSNIITNLKINETTDYSTITTSKITSYSFKEWNTQSNGSGVSYQPSSQYTTNASLNLYAQYSISNIEYETFTTEKPTLEGHYFLGWSDSPDGEIIWNGEGTYQPTSNQTLYAQWELNGWKKISIVYYDKDLNQLPAQEIKYYNNGKWVKISAIKYYTDI